MRKTILILLFGLIAVFGAGVAHADSLDGAGLLSGSDLAVIVGPTGIASPNATYIADAEALYLEPNGFSPAGIAVDLPFYPASDDFGPSVLAGQYALTTGAVLDYYLGVFNAADPLTLFCYSQGAVVCNNAEPTLINFGIPSDAIRIVEVGDTSSAQTGWDGAPGPIDGFLDNTAAPGTLTAFVLEALGWGNLVGDTTPNNDYATYVYTIYGDIWADVANPVCLLCHDAYLGLTPAEISSAVPVIDGLTTYFDIPALSTTALDNALLASAGAL
ncbi:hypothetical protein [Mycobacterium sp.]|uniref:hypothetical protein n=1 Tax=Mycobacterium sp. TaxID=1785 RepID=UPI003C71963B